MHLDFSSQILVLWKAAVITIVWGIWTFRNKAIYENLVSTPSILINIVRVTMREMDFMHGKKGYMKNEIKDLMILKALNVKVRPAPLKKALSVIWRPPPFGWIKINTDGAAQGAPGKMST
ncbi:Polynucleotidyl transferase [Perilla frutescens var. frutescens]|nr:Polynucleotidyl transferase [Perilla frutescens var. frutescens]